MGNSVSYTVSQQNGKEMKFRLFAITWFLIDCYGANPPIVEVEQGLVLGTFYTLPNGRPVHAFYRIPYAAPPVRENRFKAPQMAEQWDDIWNATAPSASCLQLSFPDHSITGDENCLYLNIFTPRKEVYPDGIILGVHSSKTQDFAPLEILLLFYTAPTYTTILKLRKKAGKYLNVLVFIDGHTFTHSRANEFRPSYIMKDNDLVFVTISYRVGVMGFFSAGDTIVPGNNGLKDQVAALKWIKRNIMKFGGNPDNVTIFGTSAGAASVQYHYLSRLSNGLFHKGISLSGSVLNPWTLPQNNTNRSFHLATLIGCPTRHTLDMVECMRRKSGKEILESSKHFFGWNLSPFTIFGPVVEPKHPNAFIYEDPAILLETKQVTNAPWLIGLSKDEGLFPSAHFITDENSLQELDERWNEIAPDLLMYSYSVSSQEERDRISEAVRKLYFGYNRISNETLNKLISMIGHRKYMLGACRAIKLQATAIEEDVYCFLFDYRGEASLTDKYPKKIVNEQVAHGDAANYIVNYLPESSERTFSDNVMVDFMSSLFMNFMKTGKTNRSVYYWQPVTKDQKDKLNCLQIEFPTVRRMVIYNDTSIQKFWKKQIPSEYPARFIKSKIRTEEL